jgi:MSHA pilin protein MshC
MNRNAGFTLLELIITIVIVGILTVSVVSRFADSDAFSAKVERENLLSVLSLAQQQALSGKPTQFILLDTPPRVTVRNNATSADYQFASVVFPQPLSSGITLTPASLALTYNGLGEIALATLITINLNGAPDSQICVETSGYAHAQAVGTACP